MKIGVKWRRGDAVWDVVVKGVGGSDRVDGAMKRGRDGGTPGRNHFRVDESESSLNLMLMMALRRKR